jgi:hypothetical protein
LYRQRNPSHRRSPSQSKLALGYNLENRFANVPAPCLIAPGKSIQILRFANSHTEHNSQCGIPNNPELTSTIFLFHPKENGIYDRVFIFAHELGHAIHLALTHDINILPDGFDEFNTKLGVKLKTLKEKQEAFADSAALEILNTKGLRTHFPTGMSKDMSYIHANYLRKLCMAALRKRGILSEPLPPPNSPFDKVLTDICEGRVAFPRNP